MGYRGTKIVVWDEIEEPAWGGVEKGRTVILVVSTEGGGVALVDVENGGHGGRACVRREGQVGVD
jgi:hypothetical protein